VIFDAVCRPNMIYRKACLRTALSESQEIMMQLFEPSLALWRFVLSGPVATIGSDLRIVS
jgi:hypothetical protein